MASQCDSGAQLTGPVDRPDRVPRAVAPPGTGDLPGRRIVVEYPRESGAIVVDLAGGPASDAATDALLTAILDARDLHEAEERLSSILPEIGGTVVRRPPDSSSAFLTPTFTARGRRWARSVPSLERGRSPSGHAR